MTAQNPTCPHTPGLLRQPADRLLRLLYAVTHNSMALLGLGLAIVALVLLANPVLRDDAEQKLLGWLQQRQSGEILASAETDLAASGSATAALPRQQAQVANWISRKYRVAPEPVSALVAEAFALGSRIKLDPTLILAVAAIESRFNPFAQSPVGAQGLMQVLTRVHSDKYEDFGGKQAALDPVANLRVGVQVLQDCIRNAGSTEGGLRCYVGAANSDASDYIAKVKAEQQRLRSVAQGLRPASSALVQAPAAGSRRELEADAGSSEPGKSKSS
ncbi:MAG: hypothetical protein RLZZ555_1697 [Pseudomonadota bacterium]|jgi:Transglycosylase SLT domain